MELGVQYSLVQMNGETQLYNMQLVQMRLNLYKWGLEHSTIIFSRYATCVDDVKLVQMRGGTQYNVHLLCKWGWMCKWGVKDSTIFCNLCKWSRSRTWANERWNKVRLFVMQLVQMRSNLCKG